MIIKNDKDFEKKLLKQRSALGWLKSFLQVVWIILLLLFLYDRDLFKMLISGRNFFSFLILTLAVQIDQWLFNYIKFYREKRIEWEISINSRLSHNNVRNFFIILFIFDIGFEIFFGWTEFFSIIIDLIKDYLKNK